MMTSYRVNISIHFIGSVKPSCFVKTCHTEKGIQKFLKDCVTKPYKRLMLSIWNNNTKQYEWDLAKKILKQK